MIIAHYTTADATLKILTSRSLRVSPAHTLNDPFELSPLIDATYYQRYAPKIFATAEGTRNAFESIGAELRYTNFDRFCQDSWYWEPILVSRIPTNVEDYRRVFAERFSQYYRLFFASRVSDSILMWSHYARDHTGCVIEFDTRFPFFSELDPILVRYRKSKPIYRHPIGDRAGYEKAKRLVVGTKALPWAYEKEVRYCVPKPQDGSDLVPFDPAAVKSVIFGCRCDFTKHRALISDALARPEYVAAARFEMVLSKEEYVLVRRLIPKDR